LGLAVSLLGRPLQQAKQPEYVAVFEIAAGVIGDNVDDCWFIGNIATSTSPNGIVVLKPAPQTVLNSQ
jgi:hypothetical protein